ncbi:cytosolic poly glycohydrolase, partial [Fimicolochytrium jonesii]|uniref:cytosolic poly glycohydrolase n=1 Tax=Fimicolochytrium jonesii TaxID=1396493 RepID=UPI0022FEB95B
LERYINGPNKNFIFSTLLPGMCALALRLLDYFPNSESIPLLKQSFDTHITLSQIEIAVLLANAFFCTFPSRNDFGKDAEFAGYPTINFDSLFSRAKIAERNAAKMAKLDMVFHYFARVIKNAPTGFVTFHRCVLPEQGFPAWESLNMPLCDLEVRNTGTIEDDASGLLQADFANKFIGGGVLNSGCVQEEIRFLINPELLITRLFIERLHDHEAVVIVGVERFSQYSGYADTFRWAGNYVDTDDNRRRTQIVAMDALFFANKPKTEQYKLWAIERELKKAYIAFKPLSASGSGPPSAIATGNWGCGAFAGDLELKAIIQLIAASAHSRGVRYFTFGQTEFGDDLAVIRARLADRGVTAGTLFKMVRLFHEELRGNMAAGMKLADCSLFKYLHELLDLDAD